MTITRRIGFGLGTAVVALTVSAGVYASAQNTNPNPHPFMGRGLGPGGGGPGRGGPMGPDGPLAMLRMLGPRLNFTDAQKEQVKNIADSHRDEWKALGDRARTAREALHAAITAESVDEGLIRQRSADVAAIEADLAVAQARTHAEVFQILTAEQKEQLKTFEAEAKNRMEQRRQGGRGRR